MRLKKYPHGELCTIIEDYKFYNNSTVYGSQTYTILPKGSIVVSLGRFGNGISFSSKENYDYSIKYGNDHYVDITIPYKDLDKYVETKTERRKRIIKKLCQ